MENNTELVSALEPVSLPTVDMIEVPESEGETAWPTLYLSTCHLCFQNVCLVSSEL